MVVAAYRIEINGRDLTETWRRESRLLSIDVTDKLGASADSCTLELDDRAPHIAWPPMGAQLRLWLGATQESLHDLGTYTLDVPEVSGPPHRLIVSGHAESFVAGPSLPIQTVRSKAWTATTLANMVETIASDHGLNAKVARALEGLSVGPLEQVQEPDLVFLERITTQLGACVRVRVGQLEAFPVDALSASVVRLGPREIEGWTAPLGERLRPGRVTARWSSPKTGRAGEVSAGSGEPAFVLGELFIDADEARRACQAARKDGQRNAAQLAIALTALRTDIGAGAALQVTGLRSELDGEWVACDVAHHADAASGRTAITARRKESSP